MLSQKCEKATTLESTEKFSIKFVLTHNRQLHCKLRLVDVKCDKRHFVDSHRMRKSIKTILKRLLKLKTHHILSNFNSSKTVNLRTQW